MISLRGFLTAICAVSSCLTAVAQTWTPLTNQPPFNADHATLLMDGTVLAHDVLSSNWWKLTPNINGSYLNGTWTQVASMAPTYGPLYFSSAVLKDGRVVVAGGEYNLTGSPSWTNLAAYYDPLANTWTSLAAPSGWGNIGDAQSSVLPDGRFLLAMPFDTRLAILDPLTMTWSAPTNIGKGDRHDEEGWTLLPDGTILTVDATNIPNAEKYIPWTGNWVSAGQTTQPLIDAASDEMGPQVLMPNGKVICFGAIGHNSRYVPPATPTDPGTWEAVPDFPIEPTSGLPYAIADGSACLLPNGKVLAGASPGVFQAPTGFFEYDGTNITQVASPPLSSFRPCYVYTMLMLPSGELLLTSQSGDIELYTSPGAPNNAWRPTITSVPTDLTAGTSYVISGTQFNGLSQCSNYGDDDQNATNYPIVRITNNATGHVFYCRSYNPSTMGVATGAATVSTNIIPPISLEDGPSTIQVVANGIASAATAITAHGLYMQSVTATPTAAPSGTSITGTVHLTKPAPVGGLTVNLSSNSPAATVPSTATVPASATTVNFTITTSNATYAAIPATITQSYGTEPNRTVGVTVRPSNYAAFIGQTVPASMVAGQSYAVTLQFKNNGLLTWDTAHGYKLESANPYNNTTWGLNRLALSAAVAPGATGTFTGTVIAPSTNGTYNFQWQPVEEGVSTFGPFSTNLAIPVAKAADAARYISKTGPTTVNAGADFTATFTMMNVGTNTWTTAAYSLRAIYNNWGAVSIPLPSNTAPNAQKAFSRILTAPITPGTYNYQWQMYKTSFFGDKTPYMTVVVTLGADNAQFMSETAISNSIAPNATFGATLNMKNLGTATWGGTYSLVAIGSNNFGIASIVAGAVAQNGTDPFTATFTAPATPGTYTFQMRMSHSGTKFGQATTLHTIVVSADAAQYISRTGPNTVNAGADFFVQNTMKNTGSTSWTGAAGYYMMSQTAANNTTWTINKMFLPGAGPFGPGTSVLFTGKCTAPITPATYTMQWQMSKSGVAFGEMSPLLSIVVTAGPDNAQFVSQTGVPATIAHGATFNATITMKNIGSATWDGTYSLASVGSNTFGIASIVATSTAPNANKAFTATFTAPATPGTYTFQMRMQHTSTKFGQPATLVTITVT